MDAIQFDLSTYAKEQNKDDILRGLRLYLLNKVLPTNNRLAQLMYKMSQDCFVLDGVVWNRLGPNQQHRSILLVPQHLIPDILHEAHGHLLGGHFGVLKTKQRLLQSYYWSNMEQDITEHLRRCDKCQLTKVGRMAPELLSPLPQCTEPNQWVHADLFGPHKDKKFILCVTDAFTKYVELVVLPNKEALTVATGILNRWICRFGLPLKLITDQGKEFTNKMAEHLFSSLDIRHSTTSSYHPQCNSQAEVCNKTIAKYLAALVDDSTLDWELYVPALMFAYNTSFHCSIQATPFSLTYGIEARLPSFFAPDFRRLHDPAGQDGDVASRLQAARELTVAHNLDATDQQKCYFDKKATHHKFHEGQFVLLNDFNFLNKNCKLAPKFSGLFKILCVKNQHNVELLLANGCKIVVNVARIKPYFSSANDKNVLHLGPMTDITNGFLTTEAFSDSTKTFAPPTLTPTHTRKPGRPRNLPTDSKLLSPTPTVSFSKQGRDLHPGGVPLPTRNETEVTLACAHPMRTCSQKEEISVIVQDALMSRLFGIVERSYHCIVKKSPRKKKQLVSPSQTRPGRPKVGLAYGDLYKYSLDPQTGIRE